MPRRKVESYVSPGSARRAGEYREVFGDMSDMEFVPPVRCKIRKIGTSSGVLIPADVLKTFGLKPGDELDIILMPLRRGGTQ